jgi:hypothetical protein
MLSKPIPTFDSLIYCFSNFETASVMVRLTSLMVFATLVVSGLSTPLVDPATFQRDITDINTKNNDVHNAVVAFDNNPTVINAMVGSRLYGMMALTDLFLPAAGHTYSKRTTSYHPPEVQE